MPKAILSNDKGLVQSSGNGLRLTPKNSLGGGLHFKTVEVSLVGLTPDSNDNKFLKATGITLPAQSIVLGATAVVTELANIAALDLTLSLDDDASALSVGDAVSGDEILATINMDASDTLNKSFGTFRDSGVAVGANVDVVIIESGSSNTASAITAGKLVVTVAYCGVES